MKKLFVLLLSGLISCGAFAQGSVVPENYKLEKTSDYAAYEKDVLRCIDWLMKTPANDPGTREVNAFLIKWISGSPDVSVGITPGIVNFIDSNPQLISIFMAGWVKYSLEHRKFDDAFNGNLKGVESVITYYKKNRSLLKKDEHVEEYIRMQQNNTFAGYIKKNMGT